MGSAKLKIGGAWSGVLEVELEEWTVVMLREEVAKRSGHGGGPETINLICAGKLLKDGDGTEKLSQLGVRNNAKILASRVSVDQGKSVKEESLAEEERSTRLSRLKAAAISLSARHADGSLPVEDFNLELENQSGQKVQLGSETDQRAIMMGLMLHANAKALMRKKKYKEALEVLTMGEEAFSLCDQKLIEMVDNVPILQIDMVWCYFMLRDISWLSVAGVRLAKAREGLERSHGKEASRLRLLQKGRYPEIALHLRLELLEGVVAYHSNQTEKSRKSLTSAQAKFLQLQIPDEALSLLLGMGYKEQDAKRALRMNNQVVENAVDFLVEEREKKARKRVDDLKRQKEIMEQKCYGTTPLGKAVDIERLNELVSIGFEKELAAEALRRNENDTQKALDDLTNPEANSSIQMHIESRRKKRLRQAANASIEELVSMGFPREAAAAAVRSFGTRQAAIDHLLQGTSTTAAAGDHNVDNTLPNDQVEDGIANDPQTNDQSEDGSGTNAGSSSNGGPSQNKVETRDVEMEDEITGELLKGDAYSDYDIEVTEEGEAINEYLALVTLGVNVEIGSSS
uniref:UBA domain-containing protein n=1 Tax=Solanum lycopersicum TaxID=4081 RepID=A0A3Q7H3Q2_SOLLC|nr:NEDD8 ultimate buster 1 [Solanum lycopersicum]